MILGATCDAFLSPKSTTTSKKTSLHELSQSSSSENSLPFFAAPAFATTSSSSTSTSSSSTPQSATVTTRLPLGTLFDGRDYIFITESNVRGYEWSIKETDVLLDDLMDAALFGNLGSGGSGGTDSSVSSQPSPTTITTDYELSQIVLVPTSDWDSNLFGLGNRYDVHDGQQRLVTLNLLLAGLRNAFQYEADELLTKSSQTTIEGNSSGSGGKRAVALAATSNEISGMLMPPKVRKENVMRITLRKRDNVVLSKILMGDDNDNHDIDDTDTIEETRQSSYVNMTTKQITQLTCNLSQANIRILQNFIHVSNRLTTLSTREKLRLLDYIVERVYLLVCIPETSRIARNIVMSQGRKGMDNEPIDDFKGLICFRYTLDESEMYDVFDSWDELAAEPSSASLVGSSSSGSNDTSSSSGNTSNIKSVGRDMISAACLLRASAALRTKIRSRGGDEVYEWERWLRQELWLRNNNQHEQQDEEKGQVQQHQPWQGKDFFHKEIQPASIALYKFRTGQWDEFTFLSSSSPSTSTSTKKKKNMTKKQRDLLIARLNFLRDVTMGIPSAKEAEIVVLDLLLRVEEDYINNGDMLSIYLDEMLPSIEKWTLWMALTRPSPMQRHARVFALLDEMDNIASSSSSSGVNVDDDDDDVTKSLSECMDTYEFGASAGGKRLASAILKRMNAHLMMEAKKNVPDGNVAATVEIILDQQQEYWTSEEEREEWSNRIGNLALVSSTTTRRRVGNRGKKNKSESSSWAENKGNRYKKESWLMTRQLAEMLDEEWDVGSIKDQQRDILSLMDLVWS